MTDTPRDFEGALKYAREQAQQLDPPDKYGSTWHNDCQAFVHVAYGLMTGGFASAYLQWLGADEEHKHRTGDLSDAPLGALLCSKGSTAAGHIWLAARPMRSGRPGSWSTDFNTHVFGGVAKVNRNTPRDRWGHRNLGWITTVNGYALDLTHARAVVKPLQNKRYQRIDAAISNLQRAHETAVADRDQHDQDLIEAEIKRLKSLYSKIRHA